MGETRNKNVRSLVISREFFHFHLREDVKLCQFAHMARHARGCRCSIDDGVPAFVLLLNNELNALLGVERLAEKWRRVAGGAGI